MLAHCQSRRRKYAWHLAGALALVAFAATLVVCLGPAWGQPFLKKSLVTAGNTQPIHLYADQISTWLEDGQRVFLLKGKGWIEQGSLRVRLPQGVVWVDERGKQQTGIYQLEVYGEGDVFLEEGARREGSAQALLELATRGEIRIKAYNGQVQQNPQIEEPIYRRARNERTLGLDKPPTVKTAQPGFVDQAIQPAAAIADPAGPSPGNVSTANWNPAPATPSATPKVVPLGGAVPPGNVVPTQGPSNMQPPLGVPPTTLNPGASPGVGPSGTTPPIDIPATPANNNPWQVSIRPRSAQGIQGQFYPQPNNETAVVVSSGVILTVRHATDPNKLLDIEADRLVSWTQGNPQDILNNMRHPQGTGDKRQLEFFLSGNVEIRSQNAKETVLLRADEAYYDVARNVAVAVRGDLEVKQPGLQHPLHLKADELIQAGPKLFKAGRSEVYSTILPSDPGLKIIVQESSLEERDLPKRTIFGVPFVDSQTGQPKAETQRLFRGSNMVLNVEGIPVFYFPYIQGDPQDPLGPLENLNFNYNRIFGFQLFTTWNVYDLIGIDPLPGTRWSWDIDYMSARGPAMGTDFDFAGKNLFGVANKYEGLVKAWGLYDSGTDILGGNRGEIVRLGPGAVVPITHPDWRGWFNSKINVQELPAGFTVQAQVSAISDRNFLEQFFQPIWTNDLNQETFLYVKQQGNHWAWTGLVEPNLRNWITETQWLPKADGYLLGLSIFDLFTYNLQADAAFARLRPTRVPPFAYSPTDVPLDTGRFDLFQELSMPLSLGPFKVVPYVVGDLTYYTEDVTGDDRGRLYGGGGVRGSVPFSRLYPDVQSDLLNVNGIYHKIVLSGNYFNAQSSTAMTNLPQLDRLNDDSSDQALRFISPWQPLFNPANAAFLTTSTLFDPQFYALRRLVDNRIDTRDTIDVLQMGLRQRWQTKRGFPGQQHIIDWMTFDVQASMFPHSNRDHVGELFGIIEYDWLWNIGDRTALFSNGWFEPVDQGPRVFNIGGTMNRPDRTSFSLNYRQIDPLESKAVIGSMSYAFSPKYALTVSSLYDFGIKSQVNSISLTRMGTDLQISLGLSYNSLLNNFGMTFSILPNIVAGRARGFGIGGPAMMAR